MPLRSSTASDYKYAGQEFHSHWGELIYFQFFALIRRQSAALNRHSSHDITKSGERCGLPLTSLYLILYIEKRKRKKKRKLAFCNSTPHTLVLYPSRIHINTYIPMLQTLHLNLDLVIKRSSEQVIRSVQCRCHKEPL